MNDFNTQVASTLAQRLKHARDAKGLTLAQVASAVECGRQRIWNYENRGDDVGSEMLFLLADLFEVDARWLATGATGHVQAVSYDPGTLTIARAISVLPREKRQAVAVMLGVTFMQDSAHG